METDLSCHCHCWPVKWNAALPERNQLVTRLISRQCNSVTFDNRVAFKLYEFPLSSSDTCTQRFLLVSLSLSVPLFQRCLCLSLFMPVLLFILSSYGRSPTKAQHIVTLWKYSCPRGEKKVFLSRSVRKLLCSRCSKSSEGSRWSERSWSRLWNTDKSFTSLELSEPAGKWSNSLTSESLQQVLTIELVSFKTVNETWLSPASLTDWPIILLLFPKRSSWKELWSGLVCYCIPVLIRKKQFNKPLIHFWLLSVYFYYYMTSSQLTHHYII